MVPSASKTSWKTCSVVRARFLVYVISLLVVTSFFPSCRNNHGLTRLSGKTVFENMGLEDVSLTFYRSEKGRWVKFADTRSTYHGDFTILLPRGVYKIVAKTDLVKKNETVKLSGIVEDIAISGTMPRLDRQIVNMKTGKSRTIY